MRLRSPALPPVLLALALACGGGPSVEPGTPLTEFVYPEQDVPFVDADDLRAWMEAGNEDQVVFIDNRNSLLFQDQRIDGARLVPTDRVDVALASLPLNKWLIMYCT